ncbi:MAG: diphthine--ammonia ligase [Gemmatimonadetes bacterium]|nr:diphthine--ammonia ligase [Gemmatimonadota bacterium]
MPYALMSSGGKDGTLALDRATRHGLDVRFLVNIYEGSTGRVRFHGVRHELIARQAEALGLQLVADHTTPDAFEPVFLRALEALKRRGCDGVVFGNIHLADVRAWYEERVLAAGLDHVEPLWGDLPIELLHEVVERGYRALVVSVDLKQKAAPFLGRELDAELVTEIGITDDLDPCGERGEYHTFVFDGPTFRAPLEVARGQTVEIDGHQFVDLVLERADPSSPRGSG